jgi:hypothetical protein
MKTSKFKYRNPCRRKKSSLRHPVYDIRASVHDSLLWYIPLTVEAKDAYNLQRSLKGNDGSDCEEPIMKFSKQLFLLVSIACWIPSACGKQQNIAKDKKYTLDPRPGYRYCTDPGDKAQLTDGVYTEGYFWTQASTVGWSGANPAYITIDLEAVEPISGVSFSTAAGVAGVHWPVSIFILVSDDNKSWASAGDLVVLSGKEGRPKTEGYSQHRFWTDELRTRGRYVKLVVSGSGAYIFVDEIEVYRGSDEFLMEPPTGRRIEDVTDFFREVVVTQCVKRRLRNDLAAVRDALQDTPKPTELDMQLDSIEEQIPNVKQAQTGDFRTIFPLNSLHKRIFSVQGTIWRKKGLKQLIAWQKNRWDMLSPTEQPNGDGAQIDVAMMRNEYRSAAFNLSNPGPEDIELDIAILGLPDAPNPDYVSVHDVPFTDTKSGVPVAAALPLAKEIGQHFRFNIPAGMTRQVWLTFHPKDIPAGEYSGEIIITNDEIRIPVKLKIYPCTFPDQPTLHLGGWDYTDQDNRYEVTPENRTAFISHLREHFVDTPWATSSVMPRGEYDGQGNMIREPSTENFEQWLTRWPDARNYYVFAAVGKRFSNFEMGTPAFSRAVSQWINWWVDALAKWNISPQQLGLLLVDEPHSREQDRIIIEYARIIKTAQPKVVIWEDPTWRAPSKATPELFRLSTVLCPNLPMWIGQGKRFADFYIKQRDAGRILWFYSCSGPGKLLDPYSYHRMQHWFCWKYQACGSGFWAFGDSNGSSSWNEYLSKRGAYTPLFLDRESVTGGKHMEAIREGIEDYEYLRMLRDRITEVQGEAVKSKAVDSAKKLVDTAADRVTSCMLKRDMIYWSQPKDRSVADAVRLEVLEKLVELK